MQKIFDYLVTERNLTPVIAQRHKRVYPCKDS